MTASEISQQIMHSSQLAAGDLEQIIEAVKWRRAQLARTVIRQLTLGSSVEFKGRSGLQERGVVRSIGRKNVVVATATATWSVPANRLEVV
jgi:hypothetical protein